jgi:molybdate transport system regulatory protein
MRTSARNELRGVISEIREGPVSAEVSLRIAGGQEIVAVITHESVQALGLAKGREATALIKSSFVILAPGATPLKTSARNCLVGTVVAHQTGTVNDEVTLDVGRGQTITATITRGSGETLGLAVGAPAQALIKAPHVILAVD